MEKIVKNCLKIVFFVGNMANDRNFYIKLGSKMGHFEVYLRLFEVTLMLFFHFQMRGVRLRVRCFEFPEFWFIFGPFLFKNC